MTYFLLPTLRCYATEKEKECFLYLLFFVVLYKYDCEALVLEKNGVELLFFGMFTLAFDHDLFF